MAIGPGTAGGMPRQGILSLAIKDKGALYNAYMPFVKGGGLFVPTAKRYNLGDEVFILLSLMDEKDRLPVAGKVVWITPGGAQGNRTAGTFNESNQRLTPSQLGYNGGMFGSLFGGKNDDEQARFTGEPPRASLTDPPVGYQTPSADQPYAAGGDRDKAPKATNYLESKGGDIQH